MDRSTKLTLFLRLTTLTAILFIVTTTLGAAFFADRNVKLFSMERFNDSVDSMDHDINQRMEEYASLMYNSRAFMLNSQAVTQDEWNNYFRDQRAFERYPGISTITYIKYLDNAQKAPFLAQMRTQAYFGGNNFAIKPDGTRDHYGVASLVSTNNDVRSTLGTDIYAKSPTKEAMDAAMKTGKLEATPPFVFGSGIEGFAAFLPVYKADVIDGFTLLSFRSDDFIKALLDRDMHDLRYKINDITDSGQPKQLAASPNWKDHMPLARSDTINVLGRKWEITFAANKYYNLSTSAQVIPVLIIAVGLLISIPLSVAFYIFMQPDRRSA